MFKKMISFAAIVGMVFALAPAAQAATIDPDDPLVGSLGLSAGDTFHLVFVTSTTRDGTSPDIEDYNTFVDDVANNLNGNTGSIVAQYGWEWYAIARTKNDLDEKANTHTTDDPGYPVYLNDPSSYPVVASNYNDLWDGTIQHKLNRNEKGQFVGRTDLWTGIHKSSATSEPLGDSYVRVGNTDETSTGWFDVNNKGTSPGWPDWPLYALSEPVTIIPGGPDGDIPEPATMAMVSLAACGLGGYVRRRRKLA